jgi:hypothetical protein
VFGRRIALLIAVASVAALGATSAAASSRSGLRGLVIRSPITPVCVEGVPCSAPAKDTTLVFTRGTRVVRTRTDATGHYRIALAPGWWSVRAAGVLRIGRGIEPRLVRVVVARFRLVDFDIDTGIR